MKKSAAAVLTAMLVTSGMASIPTSANAETTVTPKALKEWQLSTEIALDKKWTISFNQGISKDVDLTKYVSVVDEQGSVISTKLSLSEDQKKIIVAPVKKYHAAARYTLMIKEGLPSMKGKALKDTIQKKFETVNPVSYDMYDKSYLIENTNSGPTTVTLNQPAFNTVYKAKSTLGQGYNEVSFNAVGNLITQNERKFDDTKYYNENTISIGFENIVENTSTAPLEFYGPARFSNFKDSNEKALTYYTLQPGEQATVCTIEPKGTEFSSTYVVQDKTKTGKFTTEQFTKENESTSKDSIEFNYYTNTSSLLAFGDGYQIIKNVGDIELTLIGVSRYITIEK